MNLEPFRNLEREYNALKERFANGEISRVEYDAALDKLTHRDEYGREWRIDRVRGDWLRREGGTWKAAHPITTPPPTTQPASPTFGATSPLPNTSAPRSNKFLLPIGLGVVLLLCLCGIGWFAFLNVSGLMPFPLSLSRTATPTFVAVLTSTPTTSSTPTAAGTPSPVATETAAPTTTATAGVVVGPTPETPETYLAFDADFFAEPCPLFVGDSETREYGCDLGEYYMLHKVATTRYSFYDVQYDDAVIQATGYVNKGSGKYEYGIVFRANTDGTEYYVFTVTNDGRYNVAYYKDQGYTDLIPYTGSDVVKNADGFNIFKVVMRGDQFDFYLNDQYLNSVTDSTIPSGVVGLFFYNAEPDTEVGFDELTVWTFEPPPPTATPGAETPTPPPTSASVAVPTKASAAPTAAVRPGVYVNSLRFTPRAPKRGEPVTFFATFVNSTGKAQNYRWLVEIWEADTNKRNPYGQADAQDQAIPLGANERATGDSFKVAGGGPCVPFRAHVVYVDDAGRRVPFLRTNGTELWVNFQICP